MINLETQLDVEEEAERICDEVADEWQKAKIPIEIFQRVCNQELIEMAERLRARLPEVIRVQNSARQKRNFEKS